MVTAPEPRKGMPSSQIDEAEFRKRFMSTFSDPAFAGVKDALDKVADVAWDGYTNSRKSPVTQKAGEGYADPDYDLAVDWIAARKAPATTPSTRRASLRAPSPKPSRRVWACP